METSPGAQSATAAEVEKKCINGELWQACAGPLVNLPAAGTHVVYFPQGHIEQVAASMERDVDAQIPNYLNPPSKLLCLLHSVTLHADPETDDVYAQMTLQPVPSFDKDALLRSDLSIKANKPQTEFFCKTLTASDTSTHGGFSVPRRAAEKIFPSLDFTMPSPAQELVARDLHDNVWMFRHIYREQPKRHSLTTGWSVFVSGKSLVAGDSVLFIRDKKQQLLLGIRRANRQPTNLSSSVLPSDSMHIGILAAAAHAAATSSAFTVLYNPRASPSEFVIPLAKYYKSVCRNQISLGMRFRMMFETEDSGPRRYMGTITGIADLDPVRWKNSQWRNLQVGWDESTAGERRNRVSIWEIESPDDIQGIIEIPRPSILREWYERKTQVKRHIDNAEDSVWTLLDLNIPIAQEIIEKEECMHNDVQNEVPTRMANESFQKLVTEINKGMEQVKQISASSSGDQERLLLERMLGSYEEAQSILTRIATKGQSQSLISSSSSKIYKRRSTQSKWSNQVRVTSTYSADDDGYSWRKYGQKEILGSKYPRSYYRCVHSTFQGCAAKKRVQKLDDDPYLFEVEYRFEHTCTRPALDAPAVGPKEQSEN